MYLDDDTVAVIMRSAISQKWRMNDVSEARRIVMHGDILPAIPIVTPIYAVTAPKWQHLPAITMLWRHLPAITAYFVSTKLNVLAVL